MTQICLIGSLQVTNPGFMGMNQKQSLSHHSGIVQIHRDRKKRDKVGRMRSILVVFFDSMGIVYHEYAPRGQTVNQKYYKSVLERLRENMRKKRPALWRDRNWILHHDNVLAHRAFSIIEFLAKFQIPVLPQPPYSPDIAPADFYLFPKLKFSLKGHRFASIEDIQANTERVLNILKKEIFQECFQKWKHRWSRCVQSQGRSITIACKYCHFEITRPVLKTFQSHLVIYFSSRWCSVPKNFSYSLKNYSILLKKFYLYNPTNYEHLTQEI